jgi:hypothetical protein
MDAVKVAYGHAVTSPGVGLGFAAVKYDNTNSGGAIFDRVIPKFQARGSGDVAFSSNYKIVGTTGPHYISSPVGGFTFADWGGPPQPSPLLPGESSGFTLSGGSPVFSYDGTSLAFRAAASSNGLNATRTGIFATAVGVPLHAVVDTNTIVPTLDGSTKWRRSTTSRSTGISSRSSAAPAPVPAASL